MTRRFESNYRMKDGTTPLGEAYFNPVFRDLDLRLHAQEEVEKDWQTAIQELNEFGLRRIDEFLAPAVEEINDVVQLGFLTATLKDDAPVTFNLGEQTILISEAEKNLFQPAPFLAVQAAADPELYAVVRTIEYNRETGALLIDIVGRSPAMALDIGPHQGIHLSVMPGGYDAIRLLLEEAQVSQAAAEAAGDAAEAAHAAADAAKDAAEAARGAAETARNDAQLARTQAQTARTAAEVARSGAETAQTLAQVAASGAAGSETAAEAAQAAAEAAVTDAQTAKTGAETARTGAETARTGAETAQSAAETAKAGSETARDAAVTARTGAETARTGAETARTGAEAARDAAQASQTAAAGSASSAAASAAQAAASSGIPLITPADVGKVPIVQPDQTLAYGEINLDVLDDTTLTGFLRQDAVDVTPSGGILTLDCSAGNFFRATINGNVTVQITNAPEAVQTLTLRLYYQSGTITWPTDIAWPVAQGGAPVLTVNRMHLIQLSTIRTTGGDVTMVPQGQSEYTTPGSYSFTVPANVTSISAVTVGGGGGGWFSATGGGGGRGGDLRWAAEIPVTPGETLTVEVGAGGTSAVGSSSSGGPSRILRGTTALLEAAGGGAGRAAGIATFAQNGTSTPISLPNIGGGTGGTTATATTTTGGGGGGAAGYSGNGGAGSINTSTAGGSGAGGGGGAGGAGQSGGNGGSGGGVGLFGEGASGVGGVVDIGDGDGAGGGGGSGGQAGESGAVNNATFGGGNFGGGGGGADIPDGLAANPGGSGGVRIVWGAGRQYPTAANVQNITVSTVTRRWRGLAYSHYEG